MKILKPTLIFATLVVITSLPSAAWSIGLCIKSSQASLRSGPGVKYRVSWTVGRFMPLIRVDNSGSWSKVVDLDGQAHWVYTALLTQKFKCLAVRRPNSPIRTGPGQKFPLANYRAADKFESFKRLDQKGRWYKVINDIGEAGWIHSRNVWLPTTTMKLNF